MHRVAIYAREDPAANARGRLDAQIADLVAFVRRRHGWHVATYADVSPGTTLDRPGLAQLAGHARAGWFDVVVVDRRERVAPDAGARRLVRDQLSAVGVPVVVVRPSARSRLGRVVATLALVDLVGKR